MTLSIRYGQLYYGNLIKLLPRAAYIVVHWKKKLIVRKLFYLPGYHTKIRHVPVSNFMLPTDFLLSFGLRGPSSLKFLGTNYSGVHCDQIGPLNGPVWHFTWDMPHQRPTPIIAYYFVKLKITTADFVCLNNIDMTV